MSFHGLKHQSQCWQAAPKWLAVSSEKKSKSVHSMGLASTERKTELCMCSSHEGKSYVSDDHKNMWLLPPCELKYGSESKTSPL
eukprot:CAMPEP_0175299710 /NCGR_PEP_ID=MMETSP0093-20121207/60744_1 /TAXON_ID=311494 /ORGANISM="Alexandrium monilatum, Strain CCMP3105" /LENGTH=83 /DNA_ID=CAMNT_0016595865 /DNA_START=134 /DNA_END=385 /DNA_ORIENTATION=+